MPPTSTFETEASIDWKQDDLLSRRKTRRVVGVDASRDWRGSGADTEFGENTSGGVFVFGDFDDAHTTRALRTHANIDLEHSLEEPGPWVSRRLGRRSEISFFARPEEWQLSAFLDGLLGNDLSTDFGIGGEDAVISVHVKSRRSEASDEVQGLEQDGFSAVFPWLLEAVAQTAIAVFFESFERERWASDISTHALESLSVATIDGDSGVDVDAIELGI